MAFTNTRRQLFKKMTLLAALLAGVVIQTGCSSSSSGSTTTTSVSLPTVSVSCGSKSCVQ